VDVGGQWGAFHLIPTTSGRFESLINTTNGAQAAGSVVVLRRRCKCGGRGRCGAPVI
jgi:hypothetical protein